MIRKTYLALIAVLATVATVGIVREANALMGVDGVAAIVNDEIITLGDLEQRMTLFIGTLGLEDNLALRDDIRPRIMETLILESLKKQEALRHNLRPTPQQYENALRYLERLNNIPQGGFEDYMKQKGYARSAWFGQLESQLYWDNYVSTYLQPLVSVGDNEINDVLESYSHRKQEDEYLLSELYLPVIGGDESKVMSTALQLSGALLSSESLEKDFALFATQHSQAASSAAGGDIGWVGLDEVHVAVREALKKAPIGHIQGPLQVPGGVYVFYLRDRRSFGGEDSFEVNLQQVSVGNDVDDAEDIIEEGRAIAKSPDFNCERQGNYASIPSLTLRDLGQMSLSDLSLPLARAVETLPEGGVSDVISIGEELMFLKLCGRATRKVALPSREAVRERIFYQRLEKLVQKQIRDLWRSSHVEMRI